MTTVHMGLQLRKSTSPIQPFLFPEMAIDPVSDDARKLAGKSVVDKLLKIRRELDGVEKDFVTQINFAIEDIRSLVRLSDHQREELVLYSIERQGAVTFEEIAGDTRLAVSVVKEIVAKLKEEGRMYSAKRYVPLSGRQYHMGKSERAGIPEAD